MAGIILNRITTSVDCMLRQQQAGFRKGRSCCDQIFALRQIIEKITAGDSKLLVNFIDFKKAFDCVHRPAVWSILKCYGLPDKIIEIIKSFYKDCRCAVRMDKHMGEWFHIVTGVRQGCVLSPLLFMIVMDWIMRRATDDSKCGIAWTNEGTLTDLDFADDIALLDETWTGMKKLTSKVEEVAEAIGLHINAQKTKLLTVGRWDSTETILVGGKPVEQVEEFCYLGSVITSDSSCDKEIRTRIGKANTTFGRLNNIWKDKKLNIKIKSRLYETLVLSIVQYDSETWPMTVANMKKLEAAHHKWQRRILGITWKDWVTNDDVRRRSGMGKLEDILR